METTLPPEYRERTERFLAEVEQKIFPMLQQEEFFCHGFTLMEGREETLRDEDLRELRGLDQPDPNLELLLDYNTSFAPEHRELSHSGVSATNDRISAYNLKRSYRFATSDVASLQDDRRSAKLVYKKKVEEAAAADRAKGVDHAEFLISGPGGKRAVIEVTRSDFLKIAVQFGGTENVWIIREDPSMRTRMKQVDPSIVVPPGKETELAILASYLFEG